MLSRDRTLLPASHTWIQKWIESYSAFTPQPCVRSVWIEGNSVRFRMPNADHRYESGVRTASEGRTLTAACSVYTALLFSFRFQISVYFEIVSFLPATSVLPKPSSKGLFYKTDWHWVYEKFTDEVNRTNCTLSAFYVLVFAQLLELVMEDRQPKSVGVVELSRKKSNLLVSLFLVRKWTLSDVFLRWITLHFI